ncbi:MAG TPA: STAS/SEC14 domain-containing protein [Polyangiaceae bacterium]|nr:STAS/SEC14 domain-containing protein [Polyangiaceae bacterium]
MIELLDGFPSDVLAFRLTGQITARDYDEVLMPPIRVAFEEGGDLRVYVEMGHDFTGFEPGALWEDVKAGVQYGLMHRDQWKKMAIVTDLTWIGRLVVLFGWMAPGELQLFTFEQLLKAKHWVSD